VPLPLDLSGCALPVDSSGRFANYSPPPPAPPPPAPPPPTLPPVTLVCVSDGARVDAPAAVAQTLGFVSRWCASAEDDNGDAPRAPPPMPPTIAGAPLALLVAFLPFELQQPGERVRATQWLADRAREADAAEGAAPGAGQQLLLRLLLTADELEAPREAVWALATAAARELLRREEGAGCKRGRED
jgi:hypothetical protein